MRLLATIPLALAAVVVGSVAAEAVFVGLNALLADIPEVVLVGAAYLTFGITALGVFGLGWRWVRRSLR